MTETRGILPPKEDAPRPQVEVLIVDPNPQHRDRLKDMVRQMPFVASVRDRGSPHALLDILAQRPAHVIMIDRYPGGADVFQIVRQIRAKPAGARSGIVLICEELDAGLRHQGNQAGVAAYLEVPYDLRSIELALRAALTAARAAARAAAPAQDRARDGLQEILTKLRSVALFAGFSDTELVRLLKICRTRQYRAGSFVFHAGDIAHSLFVLVTGKLNIQLNADGATRVLVEMGPGDCFGEMAIIDSEPRSADAMAATDCTVIEVAESVVNNNEDVLSLKLVRQIAILLAKKLRKQSLPPKP